MGNGFVRFLVVDIDPGNPETDFRGPVVARGVIEGSLINFQRAVFLLDERDPGYGDVTMSGEKQIADRVFPIYDLGKIDLAEMFADKPFEAIEFLAVKFSLAVGAGGGDKHVAAESGRISHEMGIHVAICRPTVTAGFFLVAPLRQKSIRLLIRSKSSQHQQRTENRNFSSSGHKNKKTPFLIWDNLACKPEKVKKKIER